jgi:hypothetical protein
MEKGVERNADGWTKIEMQTFNFGTLQTLLNMFVFIFLIIYAQYEIRLF